MTDNPFCDAAHPTYVVTETIYRENGERVEQTTPSVRCRRLKEHDGDHAAFVYLVSRPETWPREQVDVEEEVF